MKTVGCIGGYTQGGGHSPASRDFGLAADQVLEAEVVLANGSIVTANACQNSDLYFALRGGGGGSYGVVTSMTVKAYPSTPVVGQSLTIASLSKDTDSLLEAITDVYEQYPSIMDQGFSGYGSWAVNSPSKLFGNVTVGYVHAIAIMDKSLADAQKIFEPLLQTLQKYNGTSLDVSVTWYEFPSYAAYYQAMSGEKQAVGNANSAMTSRMLGKSALTSSRTRLRNMIGAIAGEAKEYTINNVELVGGGKVLTDASDKFSSVNPAWRSTYIVQVVARGWADDSTSQAIKDDITYNKGLAMSLLTPFLGSYLSEVCGSLITIFLKTCANNQKGRPQRSLVGYQLLWYQLPSPCCYQEQVRSYGSVLLPYLCRQPFMVPALSPWNIVRATLPNWSLIFHAHRDELFVSRLPSNFLSRSGSFMC